MTPAARVQAAIEVLDAVLAGMAAEQALTGWARRSRFAGSGDRAAVRDHVFDAIRCKRSFARRGGSGTGRGLILGSLRAQGIDPDTVFSGARFAPAPLSDAERDAGQEPCADAEGFDLPDWLWPALQRELGERLPAIARALQHRAPVHLRVNARRVPIASARAALVEAGIETRPQPLAAQALEVTSGARALRASAPYREGLVELQDAASQAVVEALPLRDGMRVLDYCAGGGGKALAMAARADLMVTAHDIAPGRMSDLPARATRAGVAIDQVETGALAGRGPFDLVLCDAPCSGSGAWRRAPDGKWRLDAARLADLNATQAAILSRAARLIAPGGHLAYATCSILRAENEDIVNAFLARHDGWRIEREMHWLPDEGGDGFFLAHLTRVQTIA